MKFSIVFDNSGDSLVFDALSFETYAIIEYYVDQLESLNTNQFSAWQFRGEEVIDAFDTCLKNINALIEPVIEETIPVGNNEYYLNQQVLNAIHANWVNSQAMDYNIDEKRKSKSIEVREIAEQLHEMFSDDYRVIKLRDALAKLELTSFYSDVNVKLHKVEEQFNNIKFKTDSWIEFENIFSKSLLTNSICNFRLSFNHLGRTLYNKWKNFDSELEFDDENSFDQLLGYVDISLCRPETIQLSPEYVNWCYEQGKIPSGDYLNIGNIENLDKKLNECRIVLYRNILNDNSFSIKLNKG